MCIIRNSWQNNQTAHWVEQRIANNSQNKYGPPNASDQLEQDCV